MERAHARRVIRQRILERYDAARYANEIPDRLLRKLGVTRIAEGPLRDARQAECDLTKIEALNLRLLAEGLRTGEVATVRGLSPHTVAAQLRAAQRKLGAKTYTQAVARAIRAELI